MSNFIRLSLGVLTYTMCGLSLEEGLPSPAYGMERASKQCMKDRISQYFSE